MKDILHAKCYVFKSFGSNFNLARVSSNSPYLMNLTYIKKPVKHTVKKEIFSKLGLITSFANEPKKLYEPQISHVGTRLNFI